MLAGKCILSVKISDLILLELKAKILILLEFLSDSVDKLSFKKS